MEGMNERLVVFDTETTGFNPQNGDRIVEIGCIELINQVPSQNAVFHCYINPERDMPDAAYQVHKLSSEFLSDKPVFAEIADDFLNFIQDSKLVIHNAAFDMKFINYELTKIGKRRIAPERAIDTLLMAQRKFPGLRNSLDALCDRFNINRDGRQDGHGAVIDCRLLAAVYLELMGGRQFSMHFDGKINDHGAGKTDDRGQSYQTRTQKAGYGISKEEAVAHRAMLAKLNQDEWGLA